jgi:hypothetical protein
MNYRGMINKYYSMLSKDGELSSFDKMFINAFTRDPERVLNRLSRSMLDEMASVVIKLTEIEDIDTTKLKEQKQELIEIEDSLNELSVIYAEYKEKNYVK